MAADTIIDLNSAGEASCPESAPLDQFRAHVVADAELARRLVAIDDGDEFCAAAVEAAAMLGILLDAEAIRDAIRPDPIGLDRFDNVPPNRSEWPGQSWLPTAVTQAAGELVVDWAHFAGERLTAPFFEDSVRRARRRPFNRLIRYRTPLSALEREAETAVPDGLIFHMSRCGSTLVAQMLAVIPGHRVVSEAAPLDAVVQLVQGRPDIAIAERVRLLRAMVGALGRDHVGDGRHFVLKLDSWHTLALPLFRLTFPETPWVFLYRDPVEVLVSHMRMRGWQTVFGTMGNIYGIADGMGMPGEEYAARVLARICDAVIEHRGLGGGLLIDYRALPDAVERLMMPHFGIGLDAAGRAAMAAATIRDSKTPALSFAADGARKQEEASDLLRALAADLLAEPYRQLEALRLAETSRWPADR